MKWLYDVNGPSHAELLLKSMGFGARVCAPGKFSTPLGPSNQEIKNLNAPRKYVNTECNCMNLA